MSNYNTYITRNVSGIITLNYSSDEVIPYEDFCSIFQAKLKEVKRITGVRVTNYNFAFVDADSNLHYYSVSNLDDAKKLILNQNLNTVFGGSDDIPDDYEVALSTKMFKINAIDTSGGNKSFKSDYYVCINIIGEEHNCLIECFKFLTGVCKSCNEIRKELNFRPDAMLGTKHIPVLEKYFNIEVCVRLDEINICYEGIATVAKPRIIYGSKDCVSMILQKNNHFDVILEEDIDKIKQRIDVEKEEKIKRSNKDVYYFFDYETVWDPDTMKLQPYSFAVIKTNNKGEILEEVFEINNMNKIINYLIRENIKEKLSNKILVGYNNSRFDNFILLKDILNNYYERIKRVFFVNNTILSMRVFDFEVMDLCRIINLPLANACRAFKCAQQKLSLEHSKVQSMFMKRELESYIKENYDTIKKYNLMDVKTLAELYFKSKQAIKELCQEDISHHMTLASMSYKIFKDLNKKIVFPQHGHTESTMVRDSVIGGRAQIFNRGEYCSESLVCIDCVSLYPYVMLNNVFPVLSSTYTDEYICNKIGVYSVIINNQPHIKVVPFRSKHNILNWNINKIETILTSQDIDTLLEHGCDIEVIEGFYWDNDVGQLFQSYFTPLVAEKKKQDSLKGTEEYNAAVRELCKLLMNSLSGKLIQKDYDDVVEIIHSREELNKFRQRCKEGIKVLEVTKDVAIVAGELQNYVNHMPTIYGALIYSYARSHMYDTVLSKVDPLQLYGMDTDSAFITYSQYMELKEKYPKIFGNEFGQFKEEIMDLMEEGEDGPYGIFVAPKCYCFYARNKTLGRERFIKARFKGINIDRDRVWDSRCDFNKLDAMQMHELYYNSDLPQIDVEFYRRCLREDVTVVHSNLGKTVMGKNEYINIKQHFCLKVIKHILQADTDLISIL